jgi:hypothetical protein
LYIANIAKFKLHSHKTKSKKAICTLAAAAAATAVIMRILDPRSFSFVFISFFQSPCCGLCGCACGCA